MTFGVKLMKARLALNLSQIELGEKAGVSERSIYSYEQTGAFPREAILKRLADALQVSVTYLTDEDESDRYKDMGQDYFYDEAKKRYGSKGEKEAQEVISRATALFAGGELDDDAKEMFHQSLMEVYLESKADASKKFSPRKKRSKK